MGAGRKPGKLIDIPDVDKAWALRGLATFPGGAEAMGRAIGNTSGTTITRALTPGRQTSQDVWDGICRVLGRRPIINTAVADSDGSAAAAALADAYIKIRQLSPSAADALARQADRVLREVYAHESERLTRLAPPPQQPGPEQDDGSPPAPADESSDPTSTG